MNKSEEYGLKCLITFENDIQMLHVQVKCKNFPTQCYFKHLTFRQLSNPLQSLFNNLSHLYVYMNRPEMVYFDDKEAVLKICVPIADSIREFSIELESKGRIQGLKHRIMLMQLEKARVQDQFNKLKQEKQGQLEQLKQKILKEKNETLQLQNQIEQTCYSLKVIQNQISALRPEYQYKTNKQIQNTTEELIDNDRNKHTVRTKQVLQIQQHEQQSKISQQKSTTTPYQNLIIQNQQKLKEKKQTKITQNVSSIKQSQLQSRKQFWIQQVSSLKKPKTLILKKLINPDVNFEEQTSLMINKIQLKKMLFVEIFINLQLINLSRNHIRNMEGMLALRNLTKLDLSQNMIDMIKGLSNCHRLNELILHTNKIKSIQNIFHLSNIKVLSLSKNEIQIIPDQISKLYKLVQLKIAHNKVKIVSERIQLLKNLKVFFIVANKCYSEGNKSKEVIDRLINNGVKTTSGIHY